MYLENGAHFHKHALLKLATVRKAMSKTFKFCRFSVLNELFRSLEKEQIQQLNYRDKEIVESN